jgi:hypothetical protein
MKAARMLAVAILLVSAGGVSVAVARHVHPAKPVALRQANPVRVRASAGCPRSIGWTDGVKNTPRPGLDRLLAPKDPSGGLICRFRALGGVEGPHVQHGKLTRSIPLTRAAARRLASELDRIPEPPKGAIYACPMDVAQYDLLVLSYRSAPDVDILINRTGCRGITNGFTSRIAINPQAQRFFDDLDRVEAR